MTETDRRYAARRELWRQAIPDNWIANYRVLDAGTGEGHSTRFLAERNPAQLVSITVNPDDIEPARTRLGSLASSVDFKIHDLTDMPGVADASFDLVVADFLVAAVSAFAPYREIECLKELIRVLKPGGRLVVTGWDIWREPRTQLDSDIRRLFSLRSAVHMLAGMESFREHPAEWVERRLSEMNVPPERTVAIADVHHDFTWFGLQIRNAIMEFQPSSLRDSLLEELDRREAPVLKHPAFDRGFEFGRLYAVVACKLEGGVVLGLSRAGQ